MTLNLLQDTNENACWKPFQQAFHIALNLWVESLLVEMTRDTNRTRPDIPHNKAILLTARFVFCCFSAPEFLNLPCFQQLAKFSFNRRDAYIRQLVADFAF